VSGDGRGTLVSVAAAVALVVLGIVAGWIGLIEATALVRFGPVHLSVGAVVSGVANLTVGLLAVWGLRNREAAALPALGWFIVLAAALFGPRPGGDILLPGSGWDVISFVVVGALGAAVAAALGRRVMALGTSAGTSPGTSPDASPGTPLDR
jgi:hypothetical protein